MNTYDLTIDGTAYKLRAFNIGQLRKLAKLGAAVVQDGAVMDTDRAFDIFVMAFEGSVPEVPDPLALHLTMDEFNDVMLKIVANSGLQQKKVATSGEAVPAAEGPTSA